MDFEYIDRLARLLSGTSVSEITVRRGEQAVTVVRPGAQPTPAQPAPDGNGLAAAPPPVEAQPVAAELPPVAPVMSSSAELVRAEEPGEAKTEIVLARRVGYFRRAKAEGGEPLVRVGDWVAAGQQLGCVESMRVYDEFDAPVAGRVLGIFLADGEPVQYGQPLVHLEAAALPAAGEQSVPGDAER